jgi:transcription initiation factor TFIIIB Brf1 subunit/transcription initiation factor TFIIB
LCDCNTPHFVTDWACGDVVCQSCGVVVEGHMIDDTPEWRNHEDDTDKSRVGMAGADLGTFMDFNHSGTGSAGVSRAIHRDDPRGQALADGLKLVDACAVAVGMASTSAVASLARDMYRDFVAIKGMVRSDFRQATAASTIYLSFKAQGLAREMRFVSNACAVDARALSGAARDVKDALKEKPYGAKLGTALRFGGLVDVFLDRMVHGGSMTIEDRKKVWREATALDAVASERVDCGCKPRTLCSGLLFLAIKRVGVSIAKKEVATACGVGVQSLDKAVAIISAALV